MAGQTVMAFLAEQLLKIGPPEFLGLVLLFLFAIYMFVSRFSRGASMHIGFILVLGLTSLLGGVFLDFFKPVLYSLALVSILYGGWKYFTR